MVHQDGNPIRDLLMRVTENIRWVPEFGKARELDWLRNMDDWMISKKRYYGLALPIYKCADCDTFEIMGSEDELRERAVEGWDEFEGHSPHRPWVDAVKIQCQQQGCERQAVQNPRRGQPVAGRRNRIVLHSGISETIRITGRSGSPPTGYPRVSPDSSGTGSTACSLWAR